MNKKTLNILKADFITMNGGKNNMRFIFIALGVFFGGIGFLFSPVFMLYAVFLMGCFFVPMLFTNETKYHSEKMYSILPVDRKELVKSRFFMSIVLYTIISIFFYLLMMISLKLKIYYSIMGEGAEKIDIIKIIASNNFTETGVCNLMYSIFFSMGLTEISLALHKYFIKGENVMSASFGNMKTLGKKDCIYLAIIIAVLLLWILIASDILPMTTVIVFILGILMQIARVANGVVLCAVFLVISIFMVIYKYICTVLEYDEKEL